MHTRKRYNLSFQCPSFSLSDIFFIVIPVLYQI
jgi:hypothetical protein